MLVRVATFCTGRRFPLSDFSKTSYSERGAILSSERTRSMAKDNARFRQNRSETQPEAEVRDRLTESYDDDPRLIAVDEEESPFLRVQKRVSVRRGPLPRRTVRRLMWGGAGMTVVLAVFGSALALYSYSKGSLRFRVDSSDHIEIAGNEHVSRGEILEVFGADIGRNILFVPLEERKQQLEQVPWIESASVMRLLPDRLRVQIRERTPVAFVQLGSRVSLVDAKGVIMELPATARQDYSFPVIVGFNPPEPLSTRAARMKIYQRLVTELDAEGAHYSRDISEVDLSDPEDVKVLVAGGADNAVLLHLGSSDFLRRYRVYISHAQQWRQQFARIDSVDLRYDRQVIVNPDRRTQTEEKQQAGSKGSR